MNIIVAHLVLAVGLLAGIAHAANAADDPCASFPKGTSQTPAGMCIDGVLFKDVLERLAALEARLSIVSSTAAKGKQGH